MRQFTSFVFPLSMHLFLCLCVHAHASLVMWSVTPHYTIIPTKIIKHYCMLAGVIIGKTGTSLYLMPSLPKGSGSENCYTKLCVYSFSADIHDKNRKVGRKEWVKSGL